MYFGRLFFIVVLPYLMAIGFANWVPPFCDLLILNVPLKCYNATNCELFRKCLGLPYNKE